MLNLVYAAGVIETPSRITRPGVEIRGAPLTVRSETQYLQAYLSLGTPYTLFTVRRCRRRPRYYGPLFISELKARIIQAVLAARSAHEISFVFNPRCRHIRLRNEKMLRFFTIFSQFTYLWLYVIFMIIIVD